MLFIRYRLIEGMGKTIFFPSSIMGALNVAHTPGFEYDVFISYSRTKADSQWIVQFEQRLTSRLMEKLSNKVSVFRDSKELGGNDELTPALKNAVAKSAVFVLVVCDNYFTRPWCELECRQFMAANPGRKWIGRVFPVRYNDVDHKKYQTLFGGDLKGDDFCCKIEDSQSYRELDCDGAEFDIAIIKLRDRILKQLSLLAQSEPHDPGESKPSTNPVVLLAESPSKQCDELVTYLTGLKIDVLQPGADFYETPGYEDRFDELVGRADLYVQLLGRKFWPHDDDAIHSWDRWQRQRVADSAKKTPQQRWFNKFDNAGNVIPLEKLDATHRDLVTLPGTWDCDFQRFKQMVVDEAQRLAFDRRKLKQASENSDQPMIIIRSDKSDREFAENLGATLTSLKCESLRVPDKAVESLENFALENPAHGLLLVYRECPGSWVLKRLQELRNFLKSELGRRWACGLWKEPLDDDPLSFTLNGLQVIDPRDERTLHRFVERLRRPDGAEGIA